MREGVLAIRRMDSEAGASATEYAMLIAGIALVLLAAISPFTNALTHMWATLAASFTG